MSIPNELNARRRAVVDADPEAEPMTDGADLDDPDLDAAGPDGTEGADYSRPVVPPRRLKATLERGGQRLDVALAGLLPEHSRSRLQAWIRDGRVRVDGLAVTEPKVRLLGGEVIDVEPALAPEAMAFAAEAVDFPVIYEDAAIAIIDKPAGLVVHPGSGNWSGTLMNGLLHRYPETAALPRAGIVHRLDKDTSGLMVVARTAEAQTDLVRQLQARSVKRQYLAVVIGVPAQASGVVDAPIGRHPTQRTKMAIVETGKPARTRWRVLQTLRGGAVVRCDLDTGRTHQIRVHMASLRLPLVGDPLYRGRVQGPPFARQALHAQKLGLLHPVTRHPLEWKSSLPEDIADLIESLRLDEPAVPHAAEGEDWDELDDGYGEDDEDDFDGDGPEIIVVRE
jgi:23S rRNA pseudouridine1911/1915/1917 synthase